MNKNVLVFDIGTQSMRCSIFNKVGKQLGFTSVKYEVPYLSPEKGACEQDIDFYIDTMAKLSSSLKKQNENIFNDIAGVVIVDIRDSSVILDENKKPIRNAILWLDERRVQIKKNNFSLFNRLIFKLIGKWDVAIKNSERTACQLIKANEKENFKKMKYYVPLGAYFNYKLTNNLVVSAADCIGHFPVNFKKGTYNSTLHPMNNVFAIPKSALVPLIKPGSEIGKITKDFASISGIKEGIPLFASGSDKACETLGNGCVEPNICSISLGTACTVDVCSHKYKETYKFLPSYSAPYYGDYHLELQVYSGFWLVSWFINNFVTEKEKEEAKKLNVSIEEYLNMQMNKLNPGNDGLVLQPYWYAALERPDAKGSITGFSFNQNKYSLYRAIIEGEAYCLLEGLEAIRKKTKKKIEKIVLSGGGAISDIICQLFADVFNIKVIRNTEKESASLGGAISGFLALKEYSTPQEAIKHMVTYKDEFIPNIKNHKAYNFVYKNIYLKMYKQGKKLFHQNKLFNINFNKDKN